MQTYNLKDNLKDKIAPVSYIINGGEKSFITTDNILYKLSNGETYYIPKGFRFDGASVPRIFWWYLPQLDSRILAVILHDHMYVYDYLRNELGDYKARLFIDKEMLIWCDKSVPKEKIKNRVMYLGVRLFGDSIFKR